MLYACHMHATTAHACCRYGAPMLHLYACRTHATPALHVHCTFAACVLHNITLVASVLHVAMAKYDRSDSAISRTTHALAWRSRLCDGNAVSKTELFAVLSSPFILGSSIEIRRRGKPEIAPGFLPTVNAVFNRVLIESSMRRIFVHDGMLDGVVYGILYGMFGGMFDRHHGDICCDRRWHTSHSSNEYVVINNQYAG